MMPKSTATSRPASSRNRLPGCMSAWKKPSRSAWRRKLWITLRPRSGRSTCDCFEPGVVVQRDAVDPFHRQHVMGGAVPIDGRHAEIRIVAGVLRHLGQSGRLEPQVHLHRDRARHRVDDLDQPQPPRFGRMRFRIVRDEEEIAEVAAETRGDIGPEHFHRDRFAYAVPFGLAAMHLGDGSGGHRRAEADKRLRHRAFQRLGDDGLGFGFAKTAAAGPAGFPGRAPSRRRPRRAGSPETGRA